MHTSLPVPSAHAVSDCSEGHQNQRVIFNEERRALGFNSLLLLDHNLSFPPRSSELFDTDGDSYSIEKVEAISSKDSGRALYLSAHEMVYITPRSLHYCCLHPLPFHSMLVTNLITALSNRVIPLSNSSMLSPSFRYA